MRPPSPVTTPLSMTPVLRWNLAFSAGAVAAGWALVSPAFAGSLALGAALETANFRSLYRTCQLIAGAGEPGGRPALVGFSLRFLLLGLCLGTAIWAGAHPIGLLIGLSIIVPSVVLAAWLARPLPGPASPAPPPDDESWDEWNPWLAREREPRPDAEESEA